jgi:hypothetical protein
MDGIVFPQDGEDVVVALVLKDVGTEKLVIVLIGPRCRAHRIFPPSRAADSMDSQS